VFRYLRRGVPRSARSQRKRKELIVRLEILLSDAPDVLGMVQGALRPPLSSHRHAVRVDRPNAGV
jgi:hypothetical protein